MRLGTTEIRAISQTMGFAPLTATGNDRTMKSQLSFQHLRQLFLLWLSVITVTFALLPTKVYAETLGLANFNGPSGWVRKARPDFVSFEKTNSSNGTWGIIAFYKDIPGAGNPQRDFSTQWTELVGSRFSVAEPTEVETRQHPAGYVLKLGGAKVTTEAGQAAAILVIASGYGKVMSSLFLTNSNDLVPSFDRFIEGVVLTKTSGASATPPNAGGNGSVGATSATGPRPTELVGNWVNGSVSGPALYNSVTGAFQTYASGDGGYLELQANGKAHYMTLHEQTMGTCKSSIYTARDGSWSASGGVLQFNFTSGASETNFCGSKKKAAPKLGADAIPYKLYEFQGKPAISLNPDTNSARSLYRK